MNQTITIRNPGETVLLWGNLWTVVAVGVGVLWLRDWAGRIEVAYEQELHESFKEAVGRRRVPHHDQRRAA